ncbi:MAG: 50S ribosomal protein L34e [Candidatus Aenigmarchaeota archaeon]|nr:50S ribosomal protein L34e [Candidatus Aenigmarchaeota archaeon]
MPRPSLRSTSLRKLRKKTPGGRTVNRYAGKNNSRAKCATCKKPLAGVPAGRDSDISKLSKSQKRPDRAFGGNLCSACSRREIKKRLVESLQ